MADPSTEAAPEKAPPAAPPLLAVGGLGTMQSVLDDVVRRTGPELDRRKEQSERFATSMEESAQRTSSLSAEVAGSFAEKGRIQDQYAAEIAKLQPDKPPEFHETEPLKAFGSYATVLGVLGGLFTRQPLMASLNAASAAMGSIRKRDFESFDYHMKEWRAQSDHAINLLNWQKTRYDAILQKYADKPQEALIQMRIQAAADGNLQMAEAARSGYFDQVVKMKTDMFNMADKLESSKDRIQQVWETHNQNVIGNKFADRQQTETERRNKVQEGETQRYHDIQRDKPIRTSAGETMYQDLLRQERDANGGEEPSQERKLALRGQVSEAESSGRLAAVRLQQEGANKRAELSATIRSGKTTLTSERAKAIEDTVKDLAERTGRKVEDITGEERTKIIQHVLKGGLTGNAEDKLASHIQMTDYALNTMDQITDLLQKHRLITGLGGSATRVMEAAGNIFSISDATDRKQFQRDVELLQNWAGDILGGTDASKYRSKDKVEKIADIVAGLKLGDTKDNVITAYKELDPLIRQIRADLVTRYKGEFDPDKGSGAPGVTPTPAEKTEDLKRKRFDRMMGGAEDE